MVGFYLPIAKVDRAQRMVWGYASTPTRDLDGEVVALSAIRDALPGYMAWANVREMHQPSAVGTAKEANVDDKGLYLGAKIVDDEAWRKVLEDVYKGFSIGGNVTAREGSTITGLELVEISLVDRPANPDCRIAVIKAAGVAGDAGTAAEEGVTLARAEAGLIGRLLARLAGQSSDRPPAEAAWADPGYRADGKKRYPIDTEAHIRAAWSYIHEARDAAEYTDAELARIRQRIIAAWRRVIDPDGPPGAMAAAGGDPAEAGRDGPLFHRVNEAGGDSIPGRHARGAMRMAETGLGKRAPEGVHAGHLKKAMQHLGEAHKCVTAGMACVARAGRVPGDKTLAGKEGAADGFDAAEAPAALARAAQHFERAQESHVLAHHHMQAALGHAGERGEEPGDAEAGIYVPEAGLVPLSQQNLTGGGVPAYDAERPYPGKSATPELVKAREEAAYLRGKLEALEKMPTAPRAKLFAVPRGAFGVSAEEEPSAMEKLFKGVNLDAVQPAERQAAGARLIGNMIANAGTFARPVIGDPNFRGGAGAGRPAR